LKLSISKIRITIKQWALYARTKALIIVVICM